jgi:hypothetical protein
MFSFSVLSPCTIRTGYTAWSCWVQSTFTSNTKLFIPTAKLVFYWDYPQATWARALGGGLREVTLVSVYSRTWLRHDEQMYNDYVALEIRKRMGTYGYVGLWVYLIIGIHIIIIWQSQHLLRSRSRISQVKENFPEAVFTYQIEN